MGQSIKGKFGCLRGFQTGSHVYRLMIQTISGLSWSSVWIRSLVLLSGLKGQIWGCFVCSCEGVYCWLNFPDQKDPWPFMTSPISDYWRRFPWLQPFDLTVKSFSLVPACPQTLYQCGMSLKVLQDEAWVSLLSPFGHYFQWMQMGVSVFDNVFLFRRGTSTESLLVGGAGNEMVCTRSLNWLKDVSKGCDRFTWSLMARPIHIETLDCVGSDLIGLKIVQYKAYHICQTRALCGVDE